MNGQKAYNHIKVSYGVMLPDCLIFKALKEAKVVMESSKKEHYAKLSDYGVKLLYTNCKSIIKFLGDMRPLELFLIFNKLHVDY